MVHIPSITQGLQSKSFSQPPLDETLSCPALYDWQGIHSRDHPLFMFEDAPGSLRTLTWGEVIQGVHRATRLVRRCVGTNQVLSSDKIPVVALISSSDTITYTSMLMGILRTGSIAFSISPRNSIPAVTALLSQTNTSHVFFSTEERIKSIVDSAVADLTTDHKVALHEMPIFEDLYPSSGIDTSFEPEPLANIDIDAPAVIYHSSGTTALPKPIYLTHRTLVRASAFPCFGEADLAGEVFACHAVPIFHGLGLLTTLFPISTGMVVAAFKPHSPAIVPNPQNALQGIVSSKSTYVFGAPTFVESWSQSQESSEIISKLKGICFGGGPLSKKAGDKLASNGANLYTLYAMTQVITLSQFLPKPPGMDWEYFSIPNIREVRYVDHGNNEYELVCLASEHFWPNVYNTKIDGIDAFATSDLLTPHPTKPGFWKVIGRTDDQIMHSTGEKTNPGPLEVMFCQDPHVKGAVIFGRGRFYCGVLIEPKEEFEFDPSDEIKLAEFRSLIWPTVERINAFAPTHSRLFKEMIGVTSPGRPFLYTPKGTTQRQKILIEYEKEIDALYAAVDESTHTDIDAPENWTIPQTKVFVRTIIERVMKTGRSISDDDDLFEHGLDSLQATWIRNSILAVLREMKSSAARELTQTFIYDNPSINRLSIFLSSIVLGSGNSGQNMKDLKTQELLSLVEKYTKDLPTFDGTKVRRSELKGDVVLVTGSTGSLGSNILAHLLRDPNVSRIYSISRPGADKQTAKERHIKSFEREAIDLKLLDSEKVQFLIGDPSKHSFDIDTNLYNEMQETVTHVIHNAWRVNFNVAVTSFESNIRSVRNFVDFCLRCPGQRPARLLFISSVGVYMNYEEKKFADEDYLLNPGPAVGIGYGESKWVSEMILRHASQNTPLSTTVVRCGQMTGGISGAWNEHEWFPSLVKSSVALGKLPAIDSVVCWVTAVDAGGAVVDFLHSNSSVVNLVHPRPVPWNAVMSHFSKYLNIPIVPFSEWMSSLSSAHAELDQKATDPGAVKEILSSNPALRLLKFFEKGQERFDDPYVEPMGIARLECGNAVRDSKTLASTGQIGEDNVRAWVSFWKGSGFLP